MRWSNVPCIALLLAALPAAALAQPRLQSAAAAGLCRAGAWNCPRDDDSFSRTDWAAPRAMPELTHDIHFSGYDGPGRAGATLLGYCTPSMQDQGDGRMGVKFWITY